MPIANDWPGARVDNLNTINRNGFYWADSSSIGFPDGLDGVFVIVHWRLNHGSGAYGLQILMALNVNAMFVRKATGASGWDSWMRIQFGA